MMSVGRWGLVGGGGGRVRRHEPHFGILFSAVSDSLSLLLSF